MVGDSGSEATGRGSCASGSVGGARRDGPDADKGAETRRYGSVFARPPRRAWLQIAARAAGLAAIVIVVTTAVDGDCPTDEVAAPGISATEPPIEPPRRTD
jgi:hypothetical protein